MSRLADMATVAAAPDHRVELRLSESYQRTKRNVLLASAITVVIGLAGGTTTKIPGLSDVGLPVVGAVTLVWIATIHFMVEFMAEWRMAFVQNSGIAASLPQSDLNDLFEARKDQERETIDAYLRASTELATALEQQKIPQAVLGDNIDLGAFDETAAKARELTNRVEFIFSQLVDGSHWRDRVGDVRAVLRDVHELRTKIESAQLHWERAIVSARQNLQKIHDGAADLRKTLDVRHEEDVALIRLFGTLHKSIHQIQRRTVYRDWTVSAAMISLATLIWGYHVSQWAFAAPCTGSDICALVKWLG